MTGNHMPDGGGLWGIAVGALMVVGFVVLALVVTEASSNSPLPGISANATTTDSAATVADHPTPAPQPASHWIYSTERDALTGRNASFACIDSANAIILHSPYETQQLRLCIRHHPRFGRDVYILLPSGGQFICHLEYCSVQIRVDASNPTDYSVNMPDDGSTNALFVNGYSRLVAALRRAHEVAIAANYYQDGNQTALFAAGGLDWPEDSPARPRRNAVIAAPASSIDRPPSKNDKSGGAD